VIKTALVFAAGLGKRMRPLTESTPKPLIPLAGKPLIVHNIEKLADAGVTDLVVNTHWLAEQLVAALGDGQQFGVDIRWSNEKDILDTGGGMKNALPLLGENPFIVVNSDVWTDFDFSNLVHQSLPESGAHLIMVPNPEQHKEGDFGIDEYGLLTMGESGPKYTYAGIGLFSPEFIRTFGTDEPSFPLREALQAGMACGKVTAELYQGAWEDVGTPERLEALEKRIAQP